MQYVKCCGVFPQNQGGNADYIRPCQIVYDDLAGTFWLKYVTVQIQADLNSY